MDDFRIVIPARYAATRLPGKPLRRLGDRTLIEHTLLAAQRAGAREVIVATDDERILRTVESAGGRALMTSPDHPSGSDRLAEVAAHEGWPDSTIVVNLQGDEPGTEAVLLQTIARALIERPDAGIATLSTPIQSSHELFDPNVVKVVLDDQGMALYFSRAPIPWLRGVFEPGTTGPLTLPGQPSFLRHLGLYAYRVGTLRRLAHSPASVLERAESLEQLRALAQGIRIHVSVVASVPHRGVDTEEDLLRVERLLQSTGS